MLKDGQLKQALPLHNFYKEVCENNDNGKNINDNILNPTTQFNDTQGVATRGEINKPITSNEILHTVSLRTINQQDWIFLMNT